MRKKSAIKRKKAAEERRALERQKAAEARIAMEIRAANYKEGDPDGDAEVILHRLEHSKTRLGPLANDTERQVIPDFAEIYFRAMRDDERGYRGFDRDALGDVSEAGRDRISSKAKFAMESTEALAAYFGPTLDVLLPLGFEHVVSSVKKKHRGIDAAGQAIFESEKARTIARTPLADSVVAEIRRNVVEKIRRKSERYRDAPNACQLIDDDFQAGIIARHEARAIVESLFPSVETAEMTNQPEENAP
jgi:hypothetical protein